MSYAICNVVCGCAVNDLLEDYVKECDLDGSDIGFEALYTGSDYLVWYCGVCIHEFDETQQLRARDLIPKLKPTAAQVQEATRLLADAKAKLLSILAGAVPPSWKDGRVFPQDRKERITYRTGKEKKELLACIPDEPEVHLVWSSS